MKPLVFSILIAVSLLAQNAVQPVPQDPVYSQLRALKLSGEAVAVSDLTLRRDTITINLRRGDVHFTERVEGKVVAAVFLGEGEFRLQPPIDEEKRNLALFVKEPALAEEFTELVLHFTDSTAEEILKGATPKKGTPDPRAVAVLKDREDLLRKGKRFLDPNIAVELLQYNLPARLLADVYDPAHAGFFNAFIRGKRYRNLMFRLDPRGVPYLEPEEVVLASFDEDTLGVWNSFHIASHYRRGPVANEVNRLLDIDHQEIDATIRGTELRAKVRTTLRVLADGPRVLGFDLYPSLRVTRVRDSSGQELPFIQEAEDADSDLAVIFPQPLQRGSLKLEFEYKGDKAVIREGVGNYTLIARENWYPSSSFGDRATYDMTLRIPKGLVMVASGEPQGASEIGDEVITRWVSDVPLAVAGFNFGQFKKSERKDEKLKYLIETYANVNTTDLLREIEPFVDIGTFNTTRLMDKARDEAQLSMGIYQNYFGPLPYGRIAMTQQAAPFFGQAWPMLVYMPVTAFLDETTRHQIGLSGTDFFKIVAPHEVAHQWWGHTLGWKSYRDQWMSEGFSEFSASLFAHLVYGEQQFLDFWEDQRHRILDRNPSGRRPADVASVTLGYRADNAKTGDVARNLIYPKGGYILHMIRMMMYDHRTASDAKFMAMMQDFVKTHYNRNVSTEDFKAIVEKHMTPEMDLAGNKTMDWFFDEYVYGTEVPAYRLDFQLQTSGDQTVVKGRVTQADVTPNFRMTVPIYFEREDKKIGRIGAVTLSGNTSREFSTTLNFRPKRLMLCAFNDVLATIDGR